MYTQLRTNRGNLLSWLKLIGKATSDTCRGCGEEPETGDHVVFRCKRWNHLQVRRDIDGIRRIWECWEDLDLGVWVDWEETAGGTDVNKTDHVRNFFSKVL